MTGFGGGKAENDQVGIEIEVRSVNHRFLDCYFKLPRGCAQFESDLRAFISTQVSRGRLDIAVTRTPRQATALGVTFNRGLFDAYLSTYRTLCEELAGTAALTPTVVLELLTRREVIEVEEAVQDVEAERHLLLEALREALLQLLSMRREEGERLAADLTTRLTLLRELQERLAGSAAAAPGVLRERLLARVQALEPEVKLDSDRLATEVAVMADRIDVSEELVRLKSHFAQFESTLANAGGGRKLEFILQEIGREFNTIGSKSQDAEMQRLVVEAKAELERMREQIQNIE